MAIIRGVIKQCMHFVISNLDSRMSKAYPPPPTHKNNKTPQKQASKSNKTKKKKTRVSGGV